MMWEKRGKIVRCVYSMNEQLSVELIIINQRRHWKQTNSISDGTVKAPKCLDTYT